MAGEARVSHLVTLTNVNDNNTYYVKRPGHPRLLGSITLSFGKNNRIIALHIYRTVSYLLNCNDPLHYTHVQIMSEIGALVSLGAICALPKYCVSPTTN